MMAGVNYHDAAYCSMCLSDFTEITANRGAIVICSEGHLVCELCLRNLIRLRQACPRCGSERVAIPIESHASFVDAFRELKTENALLRQMVANFRLLFEQQRATPIPTYLQHTRQQITGTSLLVIGGLDIDGNQLRSVELFSFASFDWSRLADLPSERSSCHAAILCEKVYVVGASGGCGAGDAMSILTDIDVFDPTQDKWISNWRTNNDHFYTAACSSREHMYCLSTLGELDVFDPVASEWRSLQSMPGSASALCCLDADELYSEQSYLYAVGRKLSRRLDSQAVYRYDPTIDQWSEVERMRQPREGLCLAAVAGKLYALGGANDYGTLESVECYDPVRNKWSDVEQMSVARRDASAVVHDGRIYVVGGRNANSDALDTVEVYDPTKDEWRLLDAPMGTGRSLAGVAVVA